MFILRYVDSDISIRRMRVIRRPARDPVSGLKASAPDPEPAPAPDLESTLALGPNNNFF